jgi:hypothetical protein
MNCNGDFLSCDRCCELLDHSRRVYDDNRKNYRLTGTGGIPHVWETSPLNFYPVVQRVCVFTIEEDGDIEEMALRIAGNDPHRPIFYTELNARCFNILKKRLSYKRLKGLSRGGSF